MRNFVIINGVNSLTIKGLAINELPSIVKAPMRNLKENIDGRDGELITNLGYGAYDKKMTIGLFGDYDIDEVISFFNQSGRIVFSNENDKYYNFTILDQIDYESLLKFRTATIKMRVQPFKYPFSLEPQEITPTFLEETGTSVHLSPTQLGLLKSFELEGNYYQKTLSGKNMINSDQPLDSTTYRGITVTNNHDGTYTATGTSTQAVGISLTTPDVIRMLSGLPYTNSIEVISGEIPNNCFIAVTVKNSDNTLSYNYINVDNINLSNTKTPDNDKLIIGYELYISTSNVTINCTFRVQLEQNSSKTPWEQYCGGIPSPNPQYPQKVVMVEGYNIWNEQWENGYYNRTTGEKGSGDTYIRCVDYIPIEPNTSIYFNKPDDFINYTVLFYDSNFAKLGGVTPINTASQTFTSPTNASYFTFFGDTGVSSATYKNNLVINRGTQPKLYLPYGCIGYRAKGKNMINSNRPITSSTSNGITVTNNGDGTYTATGTSTNAGSIALTIENIISLKSNLSYTNSIEILNGTMEGSIAVTVTNSDSSITYNYLNVNNTTRENTVTPNDNKIIRAYNLYWGASGITMNFTFRVQLEQNSEKTSWQMFEEKIVYIDLLGTKIAKLPDGTRDLLRYENRHLYIDKYVEKNISVSTESWDKNSDSPDGNYISFFKQTGWQKNKVALCNYFECALWDNIVYSNGNYCWSFNTSCGFRIHKDNLIGYSPSLTNAQKVQLFKNWLAEHQVETWYKLDEPQIIDLGEYNLPTCENETNIDILSSLESTMLVSAMKKGTNEITISNDGNIYSKPTIDIEGVGNLKVYLNNFQVFDINMGSEEEIVINGEEMEAYNSDNTLANRSVTGSYENLKFGVGSNTLKIDGNFEKATITNYKRWL